MKWLLFSEFTVSAACAGYLPFGDKILAAGSMLGLSGAIPHDVALAKCLELEGGGFPMFKTIEDYRNIVSLTRNVKHLFFQSLFLP